MKKLSYLIVLALILGLVLTGCTLLSNIGQVPTNEQSGMTYVTKGGPTVNEAESFPLYAGQHDLVGEILVWDDGETLCVKYQLNEDALEDDWLIYETHLAVGHEIGEIPQTKKGNPIPGQFLYGDDELDEGVDSWEYCVPFNELGKEESGDLAPIECDETLVIAAHAVVEKCVTTQETIYPELNWKRSSESTVAVFPGYGAQWEKLDGFGIVLDPAEVVWDGGIGTQNYTGYSTRNDISWASWACTQPGKPSITGTDLRRFNATFNIPAGDTVTGATLGSVNSGYENVIPMNDNIYIFMNKELIFWGGTIGVVDPSTMHFLGMERRDTEPQTAQSKEDFEETDGWYMDGTFPVIPSGLFDEGTNRLDVFAEEFWIGGGMHELGLTLEVEQTTCESETAWAANEEIPEGEEGTLQFDGKNWATYFEYTVECPPCLTPDGELTVTGTGWISDSAWCPCGYKYDLDAMGTVALKGTVDLSEAAVANTGNWSKYYAKFIIRDSDNHNVAVVFGNDWLGPWYEMDAQQWDRIRMENNMGLEQPERYYATVGGVLGYDMDGNWKGPGFGAMVYPSDKNYFFQLIADPVAQTFTLQVLAKGSGAPNNPPADWPKQNMFNEAKWLEIGSINVGSVFDFTEVSICAELLASTLAGVTDTSTITWEDMEVGTPEIW